MKKLILFLCSIFLFGANLINVNFFSQKSKIDVLLSLDNKFNGKIIEKNKNIFLITNVYTIKKFDKKFDDSFIKEITILPSDNGVLLKLSTNTQYKTSVALTPDGYGLRFRIINTERAEIKTQNLKFANDNRLDLASYFISIAILIILAIALWLFRKKLIKKLPVKGNLNILFQKPLDAKNKIALIEFNNRKYLVIVGNSNILLDVFDENMINISTNKEFDEYLKSNQEITKKLDSFREYIENAEKLKEIDERI